MLERETELIIATVQQRTIANQPAIAVKDILAADIPYSLKAFFRADVESMLVEELRHHRKASRFNFDHPEILSLQQQINSVLVLHFPFDRAEFLRRLDDAVHLMVNYLIRPQWTLRNVLFEKSDTLSGPALIHLLRYFGPYEYLKDIIVRYVAGKTLVSFRQEEFSGFLWKVESEYVRRKTGDELARILSPLYEFVGYPAAGGSKGVATKALAKFFEDKGMLTVLHRIEGEHAQGKLELTRPELAELLENVRRATGAFESERNEATEPGSPREPLGGSAGPPGAHAPEALLPGGQNPSTVVSGFLETVEDTDRKRFIKKIFRRDEHAFDSALQTMTTFPSWKQASVFIDEIFIHNDVDPYSSDAKKFIGIIQQHYFAKR